jgi:hypothetical protein
MGRLPGEDNGPTAVRKRAYRAVVPALLGRSIRGGGGTTRARRCLVRSPFLPVSRRRGRSAWFGVRPRITAIDSSVETWDLPDQYATDSGPTP